MKATIDFARVERVPSGTSQLGAQAYRVDFELAASEGPYGFLPGPQAKEMRSPGRSLWVNGLGLVLR